MLKIGNVEMKNQAVFAPMAGILTNYVEEMEANEVKVG